MYFIPQELLTFPSLKSLFFFRKTWTFFCEIISFKTFVDYNKGWQNLGYNIADSVRTGCSRLFSYAHRFVRYKPRIAWYWFISLSPRKMVENQRAVLLPIKALHSSKTLINSYLRVIPVGDILRVCSIQILK